MWSQTEFRHFFHVSLTWTHFHMWLKASTGSGMPFTSVSPSPLHSSPPLSCQLTFFSPGKLILSISAPTGGFQWNPDNHVWNDFTHDCQLLVLTDKYTCFLFSFCSCLQSRLPPVKVDYRILFCCVIFHFMLKLNLSRTCFDSVE